MGNRGQRRQENIIRQYKEITEQGYRKIGVDRIKKQEIIYYKQSIPVIDLLMILAMSSLFYLEGIDIIDSVRVHYYPSVGNHKCLRFHLVLVNGSYIRVLHNSFR